MRVFRCHLPQINIQRDNDRFQFGQMKQAIVFSDIESRIQIISGVSHVESLSRRNIQGNQTVFYSGTTYAQDFDTVYIFPEETHLDTHDLMVPTLPFYIVHAGTIQI